MSIKRNHRKVGKPREFRKDVYEIAECIGEGEMRGPLVEYGGII